jgi:hypothetical protein
MPNCTRDCPAPALHAQIKALREEREKMALCLNRRDREINALTKERQDYRRAGIKVQMRND